MRIMERMVRRKSESKKKSAKGSEEVLQQVRMHGDVTWQGVDAENAEAKKSGAWRVAGRGEG